MNCTLVQNRPFGIKYTPSLSTGSNEIFLKSMKYAQNLFPNNIFECTNLICCSLVCRASLKHSCPSLSLVTPTIRPGICRTNLFFVAKKPKRRKGYIRQVFKGEFIVKSYKIPFYITVVYWQWSATLSN